MGTRSLIGRKREDGKIEAIYCHWDGYPSHNGRILLKHYQDPKKVAALMELGALSSLDSELGEKHPFDDGVDGWCTAYGRDRGETETEKMVVGSLEELATEEYLYLFVDGRWLFCRSYDSLDLQDLTEEDCNAD